MNEQTNPTAEEIMAFDDKYSFSVEVHGMIPLSLNANGSTEMGDPEGIEINGLSYCKLYLSDEIAVAFSEVKDPDDLLLEIVRGIHDKTPEEAISYMESNDFPYSPDNEYDIYFPSIQE